jgi:hypothetical protein
VTRDEVLRIAHEVADAEGWPWQEPVSIEQDRHWPFGRATWDVYTNSGSIGQNIRIRIDGESGKVLSKGFALR